MDIDRARFLVSPSAANALATGEQDLAPLPLHVRAQRLRESFSPEQAAALSEQIDLRAKARERFGIEPGDMRFTNDGLEMATHPRVAERRARRLGAFGLPVADLTCGIGGDLREIARFATGALGVERDRSTALLAAHNLGCRADVVVGDAIQPPVELAGITVLLDPARRSRSLRRFDPASFSPPWDACLEVLGAAAGGAIKGPPGIHPAAIPADAEVEFVQLGRSLREAALYVGGEAQPMLRRAVLLPGGHELSSDEPEADNVISEVGSVLYDPASCVTRAGVVRQLAHMLGASLIDQQVAYLAGDEAVFSPLADAFAVVDVIPFSLARLKKRLRAEKWTPHEIRRRAFPIEPDDLRRQIGKIDGTPVTLLCTTAGGKRLVIVGRRIERTLDGSEETA